MRDNAVTPDDAVFDSRQTQTGSETTLAERMAGYAAVATISIGAAVLIGWLFDIAVLKSILPVWISMKANTAVCFILSGSALLLLVKNRSGAVAARIVPVCAALVTLTGFATLLEYFFHFDLGIDQILFQEPANSVVTIYPGRMAVPTAVSFILLGASLFLFRRRNAWPMQIPALFAGFISLLGLAGYTYDVESFKKIGPTFIAVHTALAFVFLAAGILLARPRNGLMKFITGADEGGLMLRRLIPGLLIVPYVAGWVILAGVRHGFYDSDFAWALFALATMLILASFICWNARSLRRMDKTRRQALVSLRESEAFTRRVLDNLFTFVGVMTPDGTLIDVNRAPLQAAGITAEDVRGRKFWDCFWWSYDPQIQAKVQTACEAATLGRASRFDVQVRMAGDTRMWIDFQVAPLCDERGRLTHLIPSAMDITERKMAEESLHQALDRLEAANRELETFAYSIAHDLRTPLMGIDGFSQLLLEDYSDKLDEQGKDYLRRVSGESRRMAGLIDDILELMRVARMEMKVKKVDLSALAASVAKALCGANPGRSVEFSIQEEVTAVGDSRLLRVLLQNLLGNAWKFTGRRLNARIEFGSAEIGGQTACFVRDDGAGFDMAHAGKLFKVFQRLHKSREFTGTGIGLALAQRIVQRHGGRIWAEGAVGKGATFYFTLKACP